MIRRSGIWGIGIWSKRSGRWSGIGGLGADAWDLGHWVPKVARGGLGVGIWGYGIGGVGSEGRGTRGLESDVWSWRSLVCGRGSADWDLEILGSRTRKLRAGWVKPLYAHGRGETLFFRRRAQCCDPCFWV